MAAWTRPKYATFVPFITAQCQILWKHRNTVETGKFHGSAQNSTFLENWSLAITGCTIWQQNNIGCIHNQKSDDPSDLRKIWLHGQIFVSHAHEACDVSIPIANSKMANHRDWGIMGYNDVIVCVTVINLTNAFFFIGLDRSHLTNPDRLDCWLWTWPTLITVYHSSISI